MSIAQKRVITGRIKFIHHLIIMHGKNVHTRATTEGGQFGTITTWITAL
jgi:hypothetical protein